MFNFGAMDNMMRDMMQMQNTMMRQMMTMPSEMGSMQQSMTNGGGNGTAYFYSSSQSFNSSDPSQNFVRTTTTTAAPGGVVETRTAVRDGRDGCEKIGLRRQLGDRVAQVERVRNLQTGEEQTRKTAHNLPDDDEDTFDREWMTAASRVLPHYTTSLQGANPSPLTYEQAAAPLAIADRPAQRTTSYLRDPTASAPSPVGGAAFPQYSGSVRQAPASPASTVPSRGQYPTRTTGAPQRIPVVSSEPPVRTAAAPAAATRMVPTSPYSSATPQAAPARQPRHHRDGSYW